MGIRLGMDLEFVDRPWHPLRVRALIKGYSVLDDVAGDGFRDLQRTSWYQMRTAAYDSGRPEAVLDSIQLEQMVERIEDVKVRAAVVLALHQWDGPSIGAALGGSRTGSQLLMAGIGELQAMLLAEDEAA